MIRKILSYPDPELKKKSLPVTIINDKTAELVRDMAETMYDAPGIGLAATQVDVHLQVIVIDTSQEKNKLQVFINPKIIKKSGAFISHEGCLSFPEVYADVRRYSYVMVKAMDENGRSFVLEGKEGSLLAKALQHEFDHLEGILFVDHVRNRFEVEQELAKMHLPPLELDKMLAEPELEEAIKANLTKAK